MPKTVILKFQCLGFSVSQFFETNASLFTT